MAEHDALWRWMKTLIGYVRSGRPDLTNRQMALLLIVYRTNGPHTVRGLAGILGVSKPVVTRALNTLSALGYLRRERDERDRRNIFITRTGTGQEFLEGFSGLIGSIGTGAIGGGNGPVAEHARKPQLAGAHG